MTNAPDIDALAERLAAAMPRLDATGQLIALTLSRRLALGAPVGVGGLATADEPSEAQVADALDRLPGVFRDDQQRVVGFMGLTVVEIFPTSGSRYGRHQNAVRSASREQPSLPNLLAAARHSQSDPSQVRRCGPPAGYWTGDVAEEVMTQVASPATDEMGESWPLIRRR
jgi:hypothetical protein